MESALILQIVLAVSCLVIVVLLLVHIHKSKDDNKKDVKKKKTTATHHMYSHKPPSHLTPAVKMPYHQVLKSNTNQHQLSVNSPSLHASESNTNQHQLSANSPSLHASESNIQSISANSFSEGYYQGGVNAALPNETYFKGNVVPLRQKLSQI
jgi:hypothetical protein